MEIKFSFTDLVLLFRTLSCVDFDCLAESIDSSSATSVIQDAEWDKLSLLLRVVESMMKQRPLPF